VSHGETSWSKKRQGIVAQEQIFFIFFSLRARKTRRTFLQKGNIILISRQRRCAVLYSKTARYSLQAMLFIAANHTGKNLLVRDIAKQLELPASFLSKILQTLSRFGFLTSIKGPRGGFALSEKGAAANIAQIVEISEGPIDFDMCLAGFVPCDETNPCPMHNQWKRIREDIRDLVTKKSIMKLAAEMPNKYRGLLLGEMPEKAKAARGRKPAARPVAKKKPAKKKH
jgi:Rrf2 family transcriptional regulator, iron-sulfur cluster assembly transcription factor